MNESLENKREYFRATGVVYLYITTQPAPNANEKSASHLDDISLHLMNFRSRINYERPDSYEWIDELAQIVESIQASQQRSQEGHYATRQSVNISGNGMSFLTETPYQPQTDVTAHVTFTVYPFKTVIIPATVVRCDPVGQQHQRYSVAVTYPNIAESDRDILIKFVNQLQRQKLSNR